MADSYSDDGAWEYFVEEAAKERRMRISQVAREGIYAGCNNCIRQARGEYVYIATSDDTMAPDCLEKMVAALESNPDCGLCQCELVIIDEKGVPYSPDRQWNRRYTLGAYDQNLVSKKNKRLAPHDGIVHPALFSIYTSLTQLLIRRTVFDRIGLFDGQWGAISDFEWDMRAGLVENCIYIPEKLATWRRHPNQATQILNTSEVRTKMIKMTRAAFARAQASNGMHLACININDFVYFLERDIVKLVHETSRSNGEKLRALFQQLLRHPRPVIDHILDRFRKRNWGFINCDNRYGHLRRLLKKYGVPSPLFE